MNSPSDHNASITAATAATTTAAGPAGAAGAVGGGRGAVSRTQVETVRYDDDGDPDVGGARERAAACPPPHDDGADSAPAPGASASHGLPAESRRAKPPPPSRNQAELLNVIEAYFGEDLEQHFDAYLSAIGVTVHMGRSVEDTRHLMARHLSENGIHRVHGDSPVPWEIVASPLGGRGVVATRDLRPGDLVLKDAPLVLGPRAGNDSSCPPVCVGCGRAVNPTNLRACPRGCRLPVCREVQPACQDAVSHQHECALLRGWRPTGSPDVWSPELLRASAPVRCLALPPERREILTSMQSHHGRQHAFEVDLLLTLLEGRPTADEERFMRLACCVMDANAFRMTIPCQESSSWLQAQQSAAGARPPIGVLRGLYPLGALLNHGCTPNTRHSYDARGHMVVRCVRDVRAGEELTVTYSALLWGTPARRQHLLRTKHFLCSCARCQDPTEGGTWLSALPCPSRPCRGPVLPSAPLSLGSAWRCSGCGLPVAPERASLLQSVLGGLLRTLYPTTTGDQAPPPPDVIQQFLQDHEHVLPPSNHISVELKADVIWGLGHRDGFTFPELSEDQLRLKEDLCRQLMSVLTDLQAGQCSLAGMLQYERYRIIMERVRREPGLLSVVAKEALEAVETAHLIIGEDNGSPPELAEELDRARLALNLSTQAPADPNNRMACRHWEACTSSSSTSCKTVYSTS